MKKLKHITLRKKILYRKAVNVETANQASIEEQNLVDEASKESFPASDPPPWTLGVLSKHKSQEK